MKLTVFNGSPKMGVNNTDILVKKLTEGFKAYNGNQCKTYKLNKFKDLYEAADNFQRS